jgi:hypothetical protein
LHTPMNDDPVLEAPLVPLRPALPVPRERAGLSLLAQPMTQAMVGAGLALALSGARALLARRRRRKAAPPLREPGSYVRVMRFEAWIPADGEDGL